MTRMNHEKVNRVKKATQVASDLWKSGFNKSKKKNKPEPQQLKSWFQVTFSGNPKVYRYYGLKSLSSKLKLSLDQSKALMASGTLQTRDYTIQRENQTVMKCKKDR